MANDGDVRIPIRDLEAWQETYGPSPVDAVLDAIIQSDIADATNYLMLFGTMDGWKSKLKINMEEPMEEKIPCRYPRLEMVGEEVVELPTPQRVLGDKAHPEGKAIMVERHRRMDAAEARLRAQFQRTMREWPVCPAHGPVGLHRLMMTEPRPIEGPVDRMMVMLEWGCADGLKESFDRRATQMRQRMYPGPEMAKPLPAKGIPGVDVASKFAKGEMAQLRESGLVVEILNVLPNHCGSSAFCYDAKLADGGAIVSLEQELKKLTDDNDGPGTIDPKGRYLPPRPKGTVLLGSTIYQEGREKAIATLDQNGIPREKEWVLEDRNITIADRGAGGMCFKEIAERWRSPNGMLTLSLREPIGEQLIAGDTRFEVGGGRSREIFRDGAWVREIGTAFSKGELMQVVSAVAFDEKAGQYVYRCRTMRGTFDHKEEALRLARPKQGEVWQHTTCACITREPIIWPGGGAVAGENECLMSQCLQPVYYGTGAGAKVQSAPFKTGAWVRFKKSAVEQNPIYRVKEEADREAVVIEDFLKWPASIKRELLTLAVPRTGEWWAYAACKTHDRRASYSPMNGWQHVKDGDPCYIGLVNCGCLAPVNFGKGN